MLYRLLPVNSAADNERVLFAGYLHSIRHITHEKWQSTLINYNKCARRRNTQVSHFTVHLNSKGNRRLWSANNHNDDADTQIAPSPFLSGFLNSKFKFHITRFLPAKWPISVLLIAFPFERWKTNTFHFTVLFFYVPVLMLFQQCHFCWANFFNIYYVSGMAVDTSNIDSFQCCKGVLYRPKSS